MVVWERSSAELRGKEVAKGCVGTKWHRVGWRQSGAQVCGSEVVQSSVRTESEGVNLRLRLRLVERPAGNHLRQANLNLKGWSLKPQMDLRLEI